MNGHTDPGLSNFETVERQIQQLLDEGQVVRPEMLARLPRREAEAYLSRYALRHGEETVLLADFSLVRSPDYRPASPPTPSTALPAEARPGIKPLPSIVAARQRAPIESEALPSVSAETARPRIVMQSAGERPDDPASPGSSLPAQETNNPLRAQAAMLASITILLLALGYLSVVLISRASPSAAPTARTAEATSAMGAADEQTSTGEPSPATPAPTPAEATETAPAPAPTDAASTTAPEATAGEPPAATVEIHIGSLSAENGWTTCTPVNDLGQVCLGMLAAYADAGGQPLFVDGAPAIYAVWVRLDSPIAGSSPLAGFSTDPDNESLPPALRLPAQVGQQTTLSVGGMLAQVAVTDVAARTYPGASPDSAPFLTRLSVRVIVTQP